MTTLRMRLINLTELRRKLNKACYEADSVKARLYSECYLTGLDKLAAEFPETPIRLILRYDPETYDPFLEGEQI